MVNEYYSKKNIIKQRPVLEYIRNDGAHKEMHSHPHPELIFVVGGGGRFELDGYLYPIKENTIIICSKDVAHSEYVFDSPDVQVYHLGFSGVVLGDLEPDVVINEPYCMLNTGEDWQLFKSYFEALVKEEKTRGMGSKIIQDDLVRVLLISTLRLAAPDFERLYSHNKAYLDAKEYFDKNYLTIENIEDVCKLLGLNKFYLTHLFKERLGIPPIKYLLNKRMERAKQYLSTTGLTIGEVAQRCGYTDTAYFCRVFKKNEGVSPLKYRNQQSENK
ncbi:MAG: helix-turn-helix domain-containing protein [Clostridiales bacterium]|nr:helix-turn-helix domain-containing protein [Clostridiales bacterium]